MILIVLVCWLLNSLDSGMFRCCVCVLNSVVLIVYFVKWLFWNSLCVCVIGVFGCVVFMFCSSGVK